TSTRAIEVVPTRPTASNQRNTSQISLSAHFNTTRIFIIDSRSFGYRFAERAKAIPLVMATIANLPLELVQLILSYTQRKDLVILSCVCKSLQRLMVPLLYQEVRWTWDTAAGRNPPIHLLLRSILERPTLASYIEHIEFRGSQPPSVWTREDHMELKADEWKLVTDVICAAQLPSEELWIRELKKGNADAFVALLISQLANLQSLELGFEFQKDSRFVGIMLKQMLFSSSPTAMLSSFSRLQRVACCTDFATGEHACTDCEYNGRFWPIPIDFDQILALFYLPSIQSITVFMPDPDDFAWPSERPYTSTLTSLVLHHSEAKEETLEQLLSVTPHLKTLEYNFWCEVEPAIHKSQYLTCDKLSRALEHIRATIEHLVISVCFFSGVIWEVVPPCGIKGDIGSLRRFEALHSLEVPLVVLLGWSSSSTIRLADILPKNMRQLCIRDDLTYFWNWEWTERACLDRMLAYLVDWRTHAPNLDRIALRLESDEELPEEPRRELGAMCERAGVVCDITKLRLDLYPRT
ncbi:MAG: hypothetical protein M1830_009711, partial [Pleopsidium flavum]